MMCALFRILHLNTKCTNVGSTLYLYQLKHSQIKQGDPQEAKEDIGSQNTTIYWQEIKQLRMRAKVKMINNIYLMKEYQLSKDK